MNRWLAGVSANQILILLAVALFVYLALGTAGKIIQTYQLQQEGDQMRREIEALKERNGALQQEKLYWQSDDAAEKAAREELNLYKPGETAVVIVSEAPVASPATGQDSYRAKDSRPNWQRWWDLLFGAQR